MKKTHFALIIALLAYSNAQTINRCALQETCSDCIQSTSRCVWCSNRDFDTNQKRCQPVSVLDGDSTWCDGFVENPQNSIVFLQNDNFTSSTQIRPQNVKIDMHPGETQRLTVTFKRAQNFPTDLYYLMDVSNTMADDLDQLKLLSQAVSTTVEGLTNDFQLGFGTFVDKPILPFTDTSAEKIGNPCFGRGTCPPAYSFRNSLPLTKDAQEFITGIQNETTSGNLDIPEGMLDALMQVVVCQNEINWRDNALHLVIVATDEQFHIAGDGKFAGIYNPNDGQCHTTAGGGGMYTKATEQDYPSVSQIKQVLFDRKVNPIFAVTESFRSLYTELVNQLEPEVLALRDDLSNDSSNILGLIKTGYERIASQINLALSITNGEGALESGVRVVSCAGNQNVNGTGCSNIQIGQTAEFVVTLTLAQCPANNDPIRVVIDAAAFGRAEVTINPLCSCNCSALSSPNDPYCNRAGTLECGQCNCNESWAGQTCDRKCQTAQGEDVAECRGNQTEICSGNGNCICGECECFRNDDGEPLFVGSLCDCPRSRCRNAGNGLECGGPRQGTCSCGRSTNGDCACECECLPGFRNQGLFGACDCEDAQDNCLIEGLVCAGHGTCECNRCICDAEYDDGDRCSECVLESCTDLCNLENLKTCVLECLRTSSKMCSPTSECPYDMRVIPNDTRPGARFCTDKDNLNCDYEYAVGNRDGFNNTRLVYILNNGETQCPKGVNLVPIILGIVLGILLIGVFLLLLWWLLARLAAYREFKAFEKDRANASWTQTTSPLYEPPTKNYQNPTYKKKQT